MRTLVRNTERLSDVAQRHALVGKLASSGANFGGGFVLGVRGFGAELLGALESRFDAIGEFDVDVEVE